MLVSKSPLSSADYLQPANATVSQLKLQHGDRIFAEHSAAEIEEPPPPPPRPLIGKSLSGAVEYVERPATAGSER